MKNKTILIALSLLFICCQSHASNIEEKIDSESNFTYSVNFMWLNKKLNEEQPYIIPKKKEEVQKLLQHTVDWREKNPEASINFWYDSKRTSSKALKNTIELIQSKSKSNLPITYCDIRTLDCVKKNQVLFSDKLPVYFQVDLARVILLYEIMKKKETTYAVYGDLDMDALNKKELFDDKTLTHLKKTGKVMADGGTLGFENGFQMISYCNPNLLKAMKFAMIDLNIERAKVALKQGFYIGPTRKLQSNPMRPLQQIIYKSYPAMFCYFYGIDNKLDFVQVLGRRNEIKYKHNELPLSAFGIKCLTTTAPIYLVGPVEKVVQFKTDHPKCKIKVPTKKVPLPPASLEYDDV